MSKRPNQRRYELAIDDPAAIETYTRVFGRLLPTMQRYGTESEFARAIPGLISDRIERLVSVLRPFDPADMVDLFRQREVPLDLSMWNESTSDQNLAHVDLVALAVLAGSSATQSELSRVDPRSVINEARAICGELIALSLARFQYEGAAEHSGPLGELAGQIAGHTVNVRNWQYLTIQDEFNKAFLGEAHLRELMVAVIGFDYEDFVDVRAAVNWEWQDSIQRELDVVRAASEAFPLTRGVAPDDDTKQAAITALDRAFVHPGGRAKFTARDIARITGRDEVVVSAVLDAFSVLPGEIEFPPTELLERALRGSRVTEGKQLFTNSGEYLGTGTPLGTDSLRTAVEARLKTKPGLWKQYERARATTAEELTLRYLASLLGADPALTAFEYWSPEDELGFSEFGQGDGPPRRNAKLVEGDGLFLIEDVAICVEVKAGAVTEPARRGHVPRLARDLKKTVGDAVFQADRLERLISTHRGLWLADGTWLDLSKIVETRSIAVCLDDLGVLGTSVDTLARAGIFKSPQLAWVTSLHDLRVIAMILKEPAEFLLYLRRRTEVGVTSRFRSVDELDLFMYFLQGSLFVEADPDELFATYPTSGPPSSRSRRSFADQPLVRRIGTFTDPLDAWMYAREEGRDDVARPTFEAEPAVARFVSDLRQHGVPGALRMGADLLGLSSEGQKGIVQALSRLMSTARADQQAHSLVYTWVGTEGYTAIIFGTCPPSEQIDDRFSRLRLYADAKKYQLRADRALTLLLTSMGQPIAGSYNNSVEQNDAAMDELVKEMNLHPVGRSTPVIPPSARRASRRLKGKSKRGSRK